jgi:type I restriction enzyme S subunit
LRINDFPNEGGVVVSAPERVLGADIERFGLHEGDIVINRVNSLSHLGKTALVGSAARPFVFESNMMRLQLVAGVDPRYIYYYLCSPVARQRLVSGAKRAVAQSSINQGDVAQVAVPLPSAAEQTEIATRFQTLERKLSANVDVAKALSIVFQAALGTLFKGDSMAPIT